MVSSITSSELSLRHEALRPSEEIEFNANEMTFSLRTPQQLHPIRQLGLHLTSCSSGMASGMWYRTVRDSRVGMLVGV